MLQEWVRVSEFEVRRHVGWGVNGSFDVFPLNNPLLLNTSRLKSPPPAGYNVLTAG